MDAEAPMESLLEGFPVVIVQPVQWGEQDPMGHVNHVTFFRWAETARIAYSTRIGLLDLHKAERIGPILASVTNNYKRQLVYPDTVHVGTRVVKIGRTSFQTEHRIVSESQRAIVTEGVSTLVVFDYGSNRPIAVPPRIKQAIESLEGRAF
jgi:acyl-CoA thioester hydrolase